jgi:hypothetical protein
VLRFHADRCRNIPINCTYRLECCKWFAIRGLHSLSSNLCVANSIVALIAYL